MTSTKTYVELHEKYDRVVVLIDMDCFYCQVEEYLDPERLSGKPIAVVQYLENAGIIAVNYAARALGVTRHMREKEAKAVCKDLICVKVPSKNGKADLTKYRDAGYQVAKVLQTFTPLLERASVDEAYLDITENVMKKMQELRTNQFQLQPANFVNTFAVGYENIGLFVQDVTSSVGKNYEHVPEEEKKAYASSKLRLLIGAAIVNEIRRAVKDQTKYECSAGIAHNKILAKLTCGFNKPNKQTVLPIESISSLFNDLAVNKVKSLGGKLGEEVCSKLNAKTMSDVLKFSEAELQQHFQARIGSWLYLMARGIDLERVTPKFMSKSIAVSKNFRGKNEISSIHTLKFWLKELSKEIVERLEKDEADCNRTAKHLSVSFTQGEAKVDGKNVSSSRVVPLNGNSLNTYTADQIANETFETIKRSSGKFLKAEGSVIMNLSIKHLGITAGKFEDNNAGAAKNLQNMLKNHHKKESIKSPPQPGTSRSRKSNKEEPSEQMTRSEAISAVKKFEREPTKAKMKVTQVDSTVEPAEDPVEASPDNPEELLSASTSFAGDNAIKGVKTLKHWMTQHLVEICKNVDIDSEMNLRAPTEITIKCRQVIGQEVEKKIPLERFSDGVIDVDVLIEILRQSEELGINKETGAIQCPIKLLQIQPSSFVDGKQWKYSMKEISAFQMNVSRVEEMEVDPDEEELELKDEEEVQMDLNGEEEAPGMKIDEHGNSVLEAKNNEKNPPQSLEREKTVLESSINRETVMQTPKNKENCLDISKNSSEDQKLLQNQKNSGVSGKVKVSNENLMTSFVNSPKETVTTFPKNKEPCLETSKSSSDISNDLQNDDDYEDFHELVRNEQRKIEEEESSKDSSELPGNGEKISYSPIFDAETDEEDIFEDFDGNTEDVVGKFDESKENVPEPTPTTSKSTSNFETSVKSSAPSTSSDVAGPSYLSTYAEFQLPLFPIDLLNPKEECSECGKMIGKLDMISHLDHHLAFQIANQQREEYRKQQQKPSSSQKENVKKTTKVKPQTKTPLNLIQKYVVKKNDSIVEEESTDTKIECEQCHKFIANDEYVSHLDYHFALKLRNEEMKKTAPAIPKVEVKRPNVKRPGSTQKNTPKMKSVKNYFTQSS